MLISGDASMTWQAAKKTIFFLTWRIASLEFLRRESCQKSKITCRIKSQQNLLRFYATSYYFLVQRVFSYCHTLSRPTVYYLVFSLMQHIHVHIIINIPHALITCIHFQLSSLAHFYHCTLWYTQCFLFMILINAYFFPFNLMRIFPATLQKTIFFLLQRKQKINWFEKRWLCALTSHFQYSTIAAQMHKGINSANFFHQLLSPTVFLLLSLGKLTPHLHT